MHEFDEVLEEHCIKSWSGWIRKRKLINTILFKLLTIMQILLAICDG